MPPCLIPAGPPIAEIGLSSAGSRLVGSRDILLAEAVDRLEAAGLGDDCIAVIAHGLKPRDAVAWAVDSAGRVSSMLPEPDRVAIESGRAWLRSPSAVRADAAVKAARDAELKGPGAFAAYAAGAAGGSAVLGRVSDGLLPQLVSGAVALSAAMQGDEASGIESIGPFISRARSLMSQ